MRTNGERKKEREVRGGGPRVRFMVSAAWAAGGRGGGGDERAPVAACALYGPPGGAVLASLHMYCRTIWHSAFSEPHECCEVHAMLTLLPTMYDTGAAWLFWSPP